MKVRGIVGPESSGFPYLSERSFLKKGPRSEEYWGGCLKASVLVGEAGSPSETARTQSQLGREKPLLEVRKERLTSGNETERGIEHRGGGQTFYNKNADLPSLEVIHEWGCSCGVSKD